MKVMVLLVKRALIATMAISVLIIQPGCVLALPSETTENTPMGDSTVRNSTQADNSVLALPSEKPDEVPMVDGRVRTMAQTGDNVWVGGDFSEVKLRDGSAVDDDVANVAVFDATTGQYKDIAPMLGGEDSEVWDMEIYGDHDVVIAGNFEGPSSTHSNLVVVDGATGEMLRWYDSPELKSVLAAPQLGSIYGGGVGLSAFAFDGQKLWTRSTTAVEEDLRANVVAPGYRDLELDGNGQTIWAACICDRVDGKPAKALVKLDTEGNHDRSWVAEAGARAFGLSLVDHDGSLYLGAGGSDFLGEYSKADGDRNWMRDTSGSVQAVEAMGGGLVVGGHFWEVADEPEDGYNACGHRSDDNALTLDPNDLCKTRHGLAAYSFGGVLDPEWAPEVSGKYNLVWALQPDKLDAGRLYFGGEFTKVDGTTQTFYARLSSPTT